MREREIDTNLPRYLHVCVCVCVCVCVVRGVRACELASALGGRTELTDVCVGIRYSYLAFVSFT